MPPVPPQLDSNDFYLRLGVSRGATLEEIRRAYRALIRRYTPERAAEQFRRIREAYEALSDPEARAAYDAKPESSADRWIQLADVAFLQKDYAAAERHYKQALLELPELHRARGLLALCLLQQGRPDQAVLQYEKLLLQPGTPAGVLASAGEAYRQLGRWTEAIAAFNRAITAGRGTDADLRGAYRGLAECHIAGREYVRARYVLHEAVRVGGGHPARDAEYFALLAVVAVHEHRQEDLEQALGKLESIAAESGLRKDIAVRLGRLCTEVIALGGYAEAERIAWLADSLDPDHPDYPVLAVVTGMICRNTFRRAMALVARHPAFGAGGWLAGTHEAIRLHVRAHRPLEGMRPIMPPEPQVERVAVFGARFLGRIAPHEGTRSATVVRYLTFLDFPIYPIRAYRVQRSPSPPRLIGTMPATFRMLVHRGVLAVALLHWVGGPLLRALNPEAFAAAPQMAAMEGTTNAPPRAPADSLGAAAPAAAAWEQRVRAVAAADSQCRAEAARDTVANSTILIRSRELGSGQLEVWNDQPAPSDVRLIGAGGELVRELFAGPYGHAHVRDIPPGTYQLAFATGEAFDARGRHFCGRARYGRLGAPVIFRAHDAPADSGVVREYYDGVRLTLRAGGGGEVADSAWFLGAS